MKTRAKQGGFTIIEIIIAILILTVGLLGLVTTAAVVTRMIGRGQRSGAAAAFAARRLERLRPAACIAAQRVAGSDTLNRGVTWIAWNRWTYSDAGNNNYRVKIWTTFKTVQGRVHVDSTEATIPCN